MPFPVLGSTDCECWGRKFKIPAFQNGHAYLTSHRACYVDNVEPRKSSVAINLKDVERFEFYVNLHPTHPTTHN